MKLFKRLRIYIVTSMVAVVAAIVVWACVTPKYAASVKISDETKETDLAVGMNNAAAHLRDVLGYGDEGVNNIQTYQYFIQSVNFRNQLAHTKVRVVGMTYGEYLGGKDVDDVIARQLNYNVSDKQQTLTLELKDHNPLVAAEMLDSALVCLQRCVTIARQRQYKALNDDVKRQLVDARKQYLAARDAYSSYADSHEETGIISEQNTRDNLQKNVDQKFKNYQDLVLRQNRNEMLSKRDFCSFAVITPVVVPTKRADHLVGYVLALLLPTLLLTWVGRKVKYRDRNRKLDFGNLCSPWNITLTIWIVVIAGLAFFQSKLDEVNPVFYWALTLWLIAFVGLSFLTYNLMPEVKGAHIAGGIEINQWVYYTLFTISVLFTPLYVYQIYKIVSMFDTKNLMSNIRLLTLSNENYGILNYTLVINQALLLVSLWRYPRIPLWQLIVVICCCITCSVANMEKISFFFLFASVIYMLYEKGIVKFRSIMVYGLGLFLLFYLFTVSRTETSDDASSDYTMLDFLGMYFLSSPIAFGRLQQAVSDSFCSESLWVVYSTVVRIFGGPEVSHQQFLDFVYVPMPTNVYTIMRPFYQDLGLLGVAYFGAVYGVVSGWIYRMARNGSGFGVCIYTYMVFVLALQFFDELVLSTLLLFIQRMVLVFLMCSVSFNFKKKRELSAVSCVQS